VCVNPSTGQGISRADLDSDDSMCLSKGGTVAYAGKCVAYGWQYLGRKPDGTLPVTGSGISTTPVRRSRTAWGSAPRRSE